MDGDRSAGTRAQEAALLATEDYDYLILIHRMADPHLRRCLTEAELAHYEIVTGQPRR